MNDESDVTELRLLPQPTISPGSQANTLTKTFAKPAISAFSATKSEVGGHGLVRCHGPMACKELIEAMGTKKLWTSPGGKTPHATLYSAILHEIYSAILHEINAKGKEARFKKTDRGHFAIKA